jgi:hypothetical protein
MEHSVLPREAHQRRGLGARALPAPPCVASGCLLSTLLRSFNAAKTFHCGAVRRGRGASAATDLHLRLCILGGYTGAAATHDIHAVRKDVEQIGRQHAELI